MKYSTGSLLNPVDYRDIPVSSFQPNTAIPVKHITDISMLPVMNQLALGSCVGHAIGLYLQYLDYKETGKITPISPRHIYGMSKAVDGFTGQGTYPRVAIGQVTTLGASTEDVVPCNDTLNHDEYIKVEVGGKYKTKGYAFVNPTINEVKQALVNNGLLLASLSVGDFNNSLVKPGSNGFHYITIYGYENERFYFRNSWGNWGEGGNGYFDWKDFEGKIYDIMAITDVPNELKPKRKYKYFSEKEILGLKPELCELLDKAREKAGVPFKLSSTLRSPDRNKKVGGVENSAHLTGEAVDIHCGDSVTRNKMLRALIDVGFNRLGIGKDFIHADISKALPNNVMWHYYPQVKTSTTSQNGIIKEAFNGNNMKYPKSLQSSIDPNSLSLTIKGILIALIPAIIIVAKYLGYTVSQDSLINVAQDLGLVVASVMTGIGLVRKLAVKLKWM